MGFSYADKIIIKHYRETYKWGRKKLIRNFPEKNWSPGGLDHLLEKIDKDKHVERKKGSGRPRAQRTKKRLRRCIKVNGGHIEHYKKNF